MATHDGEPKKVSPNDGVCAPNGKNDRRMLHVIAESKEITLNDGALSLNEKKRRGVAAGRRRMEGTVARGRRVVAEWNRSAPDGKKRRLLNRCGSVYGLVGHRI